MDIISPEQSRAARALLNITRDDLSELSGVSAGIIGRFETGGTDTRVKSVNQLRLALESAGVDFLNLEGVTKRQEKIRTYQGESIHRMLLDEIYHDLKAEGGEVLIKGLDESRWSSGDDEAFLRHHIDRLIKAGVTERLLVSEEHDFDVAHKHWYRKIPRKYFAPQTHWIFKNKVGMVSWGDIERLTIIESVDLYTSECRLFNCVWDCVGQPLD